jgi:nucleoside-diphosphate-sugar epimerase
VPEEALLRPTSLFGASKVAAETYCQAFHARHQLDTVILRYFSVYGPRQPAIPGGATLPNLVDAVRTRRPFSDQDDRGAEDFMYVDDAVVATVAAVGASRATGRAINIGSGHMTGMGDAAGMLADLLQTGTVPAFQRNSDVVPYKICAQTTLAAELLDFIPRVSLLSGLARVVRSLSEVEPPERPAFAPAALND